MRSSLLALLLLAAPAAAETRADKRAAEAAAIAALPATGEARKCVPIAEIQQTRPIGQTMLLIRASANRWYRNTLRQPCTSLREDRVLVYRTTASTLCDIDLVDVIDPVSRITFGPCFLGTFEPVDYRSLAREKP
jgi:hypothetical protein